jgi:hypothetical protein
MSAWPGFPLRLEASVPLLAGKSDPDPSNFLNRELLPGAVVKLPRTRRFVIGNRLGMLKRAAVFEVGGDASGPKRVAASRIATVSDVKASQ